MLSLPTPSSFAEQNEIFEKENSSHGFLAALENKEFLLTQQPSLLLQVDLKDGRENHVNHLAQNCTFITI